MEQALASSGTYKDISVLKDTSVTSTRGRLEWPDLGLGNSLETQVSLQHLGHVALILIVCGIRITVAQSFYL